MNSHFENFLMLFMLLIFCSQNATVTASFTPIQPLCHIDDSFALLKFKQNLIIDENASSDSSAYNKIASWKLGRENNTSCCSWDGVECENTIGRVIGFELNSSFLSGSVNLTILSTLVHLQKLNLSDNNFNYSHIPSEIGSLSRLTVLDLSRSNFSGYIPLEISKLSKLVSLDLSHNIDSSSSSRLLKLRDPGLTSLLQNLTHLKDLHLSKVDISSKLPDILANLSSLETLSLGDCSLFGEFPAGIFRLQKLQVLNVPDNERLSGSLPDFDKRTNIEKLILASTGFSGKIPESIGNLSFLEGLDFTKCNFSGSIPASLGNLSQLTYVDLSYNSLSGHVPNLGSLLKLEFLILSNNRVNVDSLSWLLNMTNLSQLGLNYIDLTGTILSIHPKKYHSASIGLLSNNTLPQFKFLSLFSCNLKRIPGFVRYQDEVQLLSLGSNKIHGKIPKWFLNISKESLGFLGLDDNLLTGFDQNQDFLSWSNIGLLDLSYNRFSGRIPPSVCNLSRLQSLGLSNNIFSGIIPPCLSNSSDSLYDLSLGGNNLHGPIPDTFKEANKLKVIDLSRNKLSGKLPKSLERCKLLRSLDLSSNLLEDVFPFWLGSLPVLQLMLLGSNKLHGHIGNRKSELNFPKLHICNLSCNNFTGQLPGKYFLTWAGMSSPKSEEDEYMVESAKIFIQGTIWSISGFYSMAFTNKGVNTHYNDILNIFCAIDFSSNQFEGEIPTMIGNLQGLELLNFSNNGLIGRIASSLGNLSNLEALDISGNKLSGEIPKELAGLNSLEVLNVSYNNLSGPIPKGGQFDTFPSNSYEGNVDLCGDTLSKKCGNSDVPILTPPPLTFDQDDDDSEFPSGFDWLVIGLGLASGLIVGLVIGRFLCDCYSEWFVKTFARKKYNKSKREKRRGSNGNEL